VCSTIPHTRFIFIVRLLLANRSTPTQHSNLPLHILNNVPQFLACDLFFSKCLFSYDHFFVFFFDLFCMYVCMCVWVLCVLCVCNTKSCVCVSNALVRVNVFRCCICRACITVISSVCVLLRFLLSSYAMCACMYVRVYTIYIKNNSPLSSN